MDEIIAEPTDLKEYPALFKKALRQLIDTLPAAASNDTGRKKLHFIQLRSWFVSKLRFSKYITEQDLIARLSILARDLSRLPEEASGSYYCQAWHATLILLRSDQSLSAAEQIVSNMERSLSRTAALRSIMWGLVCYLVVTLILVTIYARNVVLDPEALRQGTLAYSFSGVAVPFPAAYIFACAFGVLGAIVSIFFRLSEFESLTGRSRPFLMLTGAFLPIVGSIFGVVIYAMFESGAFNISLGEVKITSSRDIRVAMVIGFLCGFSERFARGMLDKVAGTKDEDTPKPG